MTFTLASGAPERPRGEPAPPALPGARIDIVVPVYNEEAALQDSIRRLHAFCSHELPYAWRIVIADNASTDATPEMPGPWPSSCSTSPWCTFRPRAAAARCGRHGPTATPTCSATRTSTCPRICAGSSPSSRRWYPATARWKSAAACARSAHRPRPQARGHLPLLQRPAPPRPAGPLLRRPVRFQGHPGRRRAHPVPAGPRRGLVLRHRAARAGPAARDAHPRGGRRLDR